MRFSRRFLTVVSGLAAVITPIFASASPQPDTSLAERADNTTNSATYIVGSGINGNLTFTLTAADDGDMWFQMSCSDYYSYMAVGTGNRMDGSLMFVMYRDGSRNGVTLSGRMSKNHVEPTYSKDIKLNKVSANHTNGVMSVAGFCSNCTGLAENKVSTTNTKQDFIWAVGPPGHNPWTTSLSGPLRRHDWYGYFQMDMTQAKGDAMPQLGQKAVASSGTGNRKDHDFGDAGHAFVMVLAWLIVFPAGVFALRVMSSAKLHMIAQTAGLVLGLIGLFSGIYISTLYERSKHFNTAHQIIGILVILFLIGQWVGGFLHHRSYIKNQRPWMNGTPIKAHKHFLGPFLIIAGLVNAALGFSLALGGGWNLIYIPVVIFMLLVLAGSVFFKNFMQKRRARTNPNPAAFEPTSPRAPAPPAYGQQFGAPTGGYGQGPYSGGGQYGGYDSTRSDIALGNMGEPPAYGQPPTQPKTMV